MIWKSLGKQYNAHFLRDYYYYQYYYIEAIIYTVFHKFDMRKKSNHAQPEMDIAHTITNKPIMLGTIDNIFLPNLV